MVQSCVFCAIADGAAPAEGFQMCGNDTVAFRPRGGGVTPGHMLVVPRRHVANAAVDPDVTAETMRWAAVIAAEVGAANIITSIGVPATQSVFHLHIHVVPRRDGDGLALPWSGRKRGGDCDE